MDLQSPLTQQFRPNTFVPKVVELYNILFNDDHAELDEGFWREFFLLRPEPASLRSLLGRLTVDELLHEYRIPCQQLFLRAYNQTSLANSASDAIALDTLAVFLEVVLNKKFASPSSDTIAVLAGLDDVDAVFTEFVSATDAALQHTRPLDVRHKAVSMAISMVTGTYRTGLVSYFINRNLFRSLIRVVRDTENPAGRIFPLCLLTLLVNYNKFEFHNPYMVHIEGFSDEIGMSAILDGFKTTCVLCRDQYAAVQEDIPEGWNLGGALQWFGLGSLTGMPQAGSVTEDAANIVFSALPSSEAVVLLSMYDFAVSNKLFRLSITSATPQSKEKPDTLKEFLSLSSYLFQYASRSTSASLYASLNLLTLHAFLSDDEAAAPIYSNDRPIEVRICRQRQPVLPLVKGERVPATVILDLLVAGMEHNISSHLNAELFHLFLDVLLRVMSSIVVLRTRLTYHWSSLWHVLQQLLQHLDLQSTILSRQPSIHSMATVLIQVFALAIFSGGNIVHDATSYDDLFSQLYLAHAVLPRLREAYVLTTVPEMEALIKTSSQCKTALEEREKNGKKVPLKEVGKVLRQDFEQSNLKIEDSTPELGRTSFREVEWRALVKKIVRGVVLDARELAMRRT